jgi:hypothetical protein
MCRDAHFPAIGDSETATKQSHDEKSQESQRTGRNPKTGTQVPISPRRVMVFKPSAILKQRINGHNPGNGEVKTD